MKKLIAMLLVICMVAGLFVGCKKKAKDPATDPTATVATEATEAPDATDGTEAPDATDETGEVEETEAPEETEEAQTGNKKPTAASKATKATKATAATKATKTTKATQAAATKATTPKATLSASAQKSPYRGKTIEIYGMGTDESYQDLQVMIDNESTRVYPYIERAAIVEWAELNGVTIKFLGSYDQNTVLAAMNAGDKPDIIFQSNSFPGISNNGITAAFTNAEYKKLADICGKDYLDMMQYGTKYHGVVRPWVGTYMLYYNATMFEEYGVKTPKEHFLEGNWNWDTYFETMVAMTKDVNGDGITDTYGINGDSIGGIVNHIAMNNKGELISLIDEPYIQDYFQLKYDAYTVKQCVKAGANKIQTNVINPMFAMQISDCEPYNWQHLYQEIPNGNRLEVAPVPEWKGENGESLGQSHLTQSCFHMAATCDESEATVDLMAYILKCGLKYISDYSLGTVDCEYEGLQGSSDYSKKVVEALAKINKTRTKKLKDLGDIYDAEYVTKINKYVEERGHYIGFSGTGVASLTGYAEITQMPPNSSIPAIKTKYENSLNVYNSTYLK